MSPRQRDRVGIFVDGSNLLISAREKNVYVDYALLRDRLSEGRKIVLAMYFGSERSEPTDEERVLHEDVVRAGFELRLRPLKAWRFETRASRAVEKMDIKYRPEARKEDFFSYSEKGVDVSLVTEMLLGAWDGTYDVAILVSGDGDYATSVRELVRRGKKVEVFSFAHNTSRELKDSGSRFVDLGELLGSAGT